MLPVVGSTMRERILSSVLLPEPLRPMIPTTSPCATSNETSSSAQKRSGACRWLRRPNDRPTPRTLSTSASRIVRWVARAPSWYCLPRFATRMAGWSSTDAATSDDIGERPFHASEEERPADEQCRCRECRDEDHGSWPGRRSEQCPAKAFHDPDHRVQRVKRAPLLRQQAARVGNRRGEQPQLGEERHDVAHVAELDVQRREPESDPERRGKRERDEQREPDDLDARGDAVPPHEGKQEGEREREIDESGEDGRERDGQSREVDLRDEVRTADEAVGRHCEPGREERPWYEGRIGENGVRDAVRRDPCEPPEEHGEHEHRQKRLQHRPSDPEYGLFVAYLEVSPYEKEQQLSISEDLTKAQGYPTTGRLDAQRIRANRCVGHRNGEMRKAHTRAWKIENRALTHDR